MGPATQPLLAQCFRFGGSSIETPSEAHLGSSHWCEILSPWGLRWLAAAMAAAVTFLTWDTKVGKVLLCKSVWSFPASRMRLKALHLQSVRPAVKQCRSSSFANFPKGEGRTGDQVLFSSLGYWAFHCSDTQLTVQLASLIQGHMGSRHIDMNLLPSASTALPL